MLKRIASVVLSFTTVLAIAFTMSSCGGGRLNYYIPTSTGDAGDDLVVTSSKITDGGELPDDLKCVRDGGDGASPPIAWSNAPSGTAGFAVLMYHYPDGTTAGVDTPNHYWLLWNIDSSVSSLSRGNAESVGTEGSDKDGVGTGYTPPCSPSGSGAHEYHIRVYALSGTPSALGSVDTVDVGYDEFISAVTPLSLATGELSFTETN